MSQKDSSVKSNVVVTVAVFLLAILVSSALLPYSIRPASAQQVAGANWSNVNGDIRATNFSPQTQITKDNVQFLELKWIFPFPQAPATIGGYVAGAAGSVSTPIVVDGIVYVGSNFGSVFALSAETGKTIWTYQPVDLNLTRDRAVGNPIVESLGFHVHGFNYFEGKITVPFPSCRVDIIDALTGKLVRSVKDMCVNIPGNAPPRPLTGYKPQQSYGPVIYAKERIMVVPAGVVTESNHGARGFAAAFNIDTGQLLWRFFVTPPAGGDKDWAIRDANKGWIQGMKTSDILAKCRQCLEDDWGKAGQNGGQAGPAWSQWAIDEETGIVYLTTAQASPNYNATYRPGPNLFTASIIALDIKTGEMKWYHQTTTHDLWDWDCSWNSVLGTIGTRKAVFKACKNGILYAFDAATGEIIWYFNAPIIRRADWTPFHANSLLGSGPKDNGPMGNWDPSDIRTVTRRWPNDPDTGPYWRNPPATGGIEADIALAYGNVYVGAYNNPTYHRASPVEPNRPAAGGATGVPAPYTQKVNASIYAIDASTGRVKWSFNLDGVGFRGGITATGGMVLVPGLDGNLYALDANTGTVLFKKLVGTGLPIPPTIAADSKGKIKLFQVFGGSFSLWGSQQVPGALVAFGQPDTIPERVVTKEVVKEVPKEVIKEVVKEVPKEVIKEVVKEVVKEVPKEVIKEVPKEVIKEVPKEVTRTVTVETISPIAYAGIGIAIIVGVAVGVALGRRRKTA